MLFAIRSRFDFNHSLNSKHKNTMVSITTTRAKPIQSGERTHHHDH